MQDWLKENLTEVWVEEVWPPSSPDCNPFDYFVWGVSEWEVSQQIQGSDPEDEGGDGVPCKGYSGPG